VRGGDVVALALDTTGSSVVPVDAEMQPLSEYYLWCDHRAKKEAQQITALAHEKTSKQLSGAAASTRTSGASPSVAFPAAQSDKRAAFASAFEHCDMVAATLCGITDPRQVKRSACAMGHKWMWNPRWDGLPSQAFLSKVDPLFDGVREKLAGEYLTSDHIAGYLSAEWAMHSVCEPASHSVGAFDAHWDAIGAGCREGDVVNVVGTSTCIIAMEKRTTLVPGVCGVCREACILPTPVSKRALRNRRHLRSHRAACRHEGQGALHWAGALSRRADRPAAPELGQWRPHGSGQCGARRCHAGLESCSHRAGRAICSHRGHCIPHRIILERMAENGVPVERSSTAAVSRSRMQCSTRCTRTF